MSRGAGTFLLGGPAASAYLPIATGLRGQAALLASDHPSPAHLQTPCGQDPDLAQALSRVPWSWAGPRGCCTPKVHLLTHPGLGCSLRTTLLTEG